MNETTETKNPYTIPIAIVIAGLFIAGAVIYTNRDTSSGATAQQGAPTRAALEIPPITGDDHILGNPNANLVIVEYSDTECPFCKNFHDSLHQIIDEYGREGEVAWVYRHFPLAQLHSKAPLQAEATECAAELGGNTAFWQYIDRVFEITPSNNGLPNSELPNIAEFTGLDREKFEACLASGRHTDLVEQQIQDAQDAGGRGTPFSVLVSDNEFNTDTQNLVASAALELPPNTIYMSEDGQRIAVSGALPFAFMKLLIDTALGRIDNARL